MLEGGEALSPFEIVLNCPHVLTVLDHLFPLQHIFRSSVVPVFPKTGSLCSFPCDIFCLFPCSPKPVRDWQTLMLTTKKVNKDVSRNSSGIWSFAFQDKTHQ